MDFVKSNYLFVSDFIDDEETSRILYATRSGVSMVVPAALWDNLNNECFDQMKEEDLATLIMVEAIVKSGEDEFKEILERNKKAILDHKYLSMTIQPTANCQLGCGYCGQVHSKKTMNDDISKKVIQKIKNSIDKAPYEGLAIEWYGGEPLMAYSKIQEMSLELIEYCKSINISYASSMITNGLSLKENVYKKLVTDCKISHFQITLDGNADSHDNRRHTKAGEPTFDLIMANILAITQLPEHKENNASIAIRINIDKENYPNIEALIDLLSSLGLQNNKVGLDFKPVVNWGDNNAEAGSFSPSEFGEVEIELMLYAVKKGFGLKSVLPSRNPVACMVVNPNSEVFDATGNIYPCYEFPYTPMYENDTYKIGNLMFHEDTYNQNAIPRNWNTDIETNISYCPNCKLFPVCGGGCPKKWYGNEVGCPSFKANIEDRLVLEYLLAKTKSDNSLMKII